MTRNDLLNAYLNSAIIALYGEYHVGNGRTTFEARKGYIQDIKLWGPSYYKVMFKCEGTEEEVRVWVRTLD